MEEQANDAPVMWRFGSFVLCCVVAFVSLNASRASAAPTAGRDPAAAELLFRDGREAFRNGNYSVACEKFAESQRLDPAPGTLINLGACNEKLGRLATAWESWHGARDLMGLNDERRARVEALISEIEPRLARLRIDVKSADLTGIEVRRDGILLQKASFGVPLPVNAGAHVIEVTGPGREPRRYSVQAEDGDVSRVVVEPGPSILEARVGSPRGPASRPTEIPAPAKPVAKSSQPLKTWGYVVGAVGIAGLVTGGIAGFLALDKASVIKDTCTEFEDVYYCDDAGRSAAESGETLEVVSWLGLGAGSLALAAGGAMILMSSNEEQVRLDAMPSGAQLSWSARF